MKGTLWKWLDLVALARSLLRDDMELVGVKYFTSRVRQVDGNAQSDKVIVRCPVAWKTSHFGERAGKSAEDIEQEIRNQSLEALRLATLMLEGASVPESPDVALERKGLIADGKLTPQGMAAAKCVLRKYGILNRLASVGK